LKTYDNPFVGFDASSIAERITDYWKYKKYSPKFTSYKKA